METLVTIIAVIIVGALSGGLVLYTAESMCRWHKTKYDLKEYRRGWVFAEEGLKDGSQDVGTLRAYTESSRMLDSYDYFDKGVDDRVAEWEIAAECAEEPCDASR